MTNRIKWGEPMTGLDGVIAAAQALKDGKKIQCWRSESWYARGQDSELRASDKYRIGEEVKPREFLIGLAPGRTPEVFQDRASCDAWLATFQMRPEVMLVREVIK